MKKLLYLFAVLSITAACTKSTTTPTDSGATIVTNDSSEFNGRLVVTTYDYYTGNTLPSANVYVYTRYEDIAKNLYLYTRKSNGAGDADFGYLLQGNYYLVSNTTTRRDTSLVQVLSKRIIYRNVYLQ